MKPSSIPSVQRIQYYGVNHSNFCIRTLQNEKAKEQTIVQVKSALERKQRTSAKVRIGVKDKPSVFKLPSILLLMTYFKHLFAREKSEMKNRPLTV